MDIQDANKIIAEYMGFKIVSDGISELIEGPSGTLRILKGTYSNSLDALVPVWEKLEEVNVFVNRFAPHGKFVELCSDKKGKDYLPWDCFHYHKHEGTTIQEAACIATAKAIKELE